MHGAMHLLGEGLERYMCMQKDRNAIIIGVCVGGGGLLLIAGALAYWHHTRKTRAVQPAPGGVAEALSENFEAIMDRASNPDVTTFTRSLSGSDGISPTALSPTSSLRNGPEGLTHFEESLTRTLGGSTAGGGCNP
jgi:hypothetical protein